jgi:hypothetical protein
MITLDRWRSAPPARIFVFLAPAIVATAAVVLFATLGPLHPLSLVFFGGLFLAFVALSLARAPVLLFWLVPLSMVFFVDHWIEPNDVLLVMLVVAGLLSTRVHWREIRLEPVELRILLFIAALGTTFFVPFVWRRLLYAVKLSVFGLLAFEVARFAARRYGRAAIAWGSVLFAAVSAAMLFQHGFEMGLSALMKNDLRGTTSALPWGRSNYVAAVLVLCLPASLFLVRSSSRDRLHRGLALVTLIASVGAILITTSRGGLILSGVFLLGTGLRLRRGGWVALIGAGAVLGILLATPLGQFLVERFTSPHGIDSAAARPIIWGWAFQRGVTHLPFGVGAGQGIMQLDRLGNAEPHNYYLTLFSEGGPLALALWLWIMAALWQKSRGLSRRPETERAGDALRGVVILAGLNSLFEPTFPAGLYNTLFWWLAGTFYAADGAAAASPEEPGGILD